MKNRIVPALLALLISIHPVLAADDGGRPGAFMDYAASVRSLGMGQAYTAIADDASAVYFNPSGTALMRRRSLAAQFSTLLEDSSIGFIGYSHPMVRNAGFGLGIVTLGSGSITRRDAAGNKTGSYDVTSQAALLSGALAVRDDMSVGSTLKIVRQSVADDSDLGYGLDLGALLLATEKIRLGLMARNLVTPSLKLNKLSEDFPRSVAAGIAYRPSEALTLAFDLEQPDSGSTRPKFGADYVISEVVAVRAGVNDSEFSAGLGLGVGDWGFDYALGYARASSEVRELGSFHRFGVQFNFGLPVPRAGFTERPPKPAPVVVIDKEKIEPKPTLGKKKKKATAAAPAPAPAIAAPVVVAKPAKRSPAIDALGKLGEIMDGWDGVPTPEIQRQVDTVSRHLRRSHYLKAEDIYAAQGYVSFFLGEYAKSVRSLEKASAAAPQDEDLVRRHKRAKEQLEKWTAAASRSETPEIRAVRERYQRADWPGTVVFAQRLLETSPNDAEAKQYLSKAIAKLVQPRLREAKDHIDADRFVEAFITFQKVLDYEPENAEAQSYSARLVQIIEKKADMDSASRSGRRSESMTNGLSLYDKGLRLYAHGDLAGARNAWENALLQVKPNPLVYDVVRTTIVELSR